MTIYLTKKDYRLAFKRIGKTLPSIIGIDESGCLISASCGLKSEDYDRLKAEAIRIAELHQPKTNCYKPWCGIDGNYCVDCAQAR